MSVRESIKESIDAEVMDNVPNETVQAVTVYLDPESERLVYSHGDGTPMPAWHGRWAHVLDVPPETCGQDIAHTLGSDACLNALVSLAESYIGSEWDGSNMVGRWERKPEDEYNPDPHGLEAAIDADRVVWRTYWCAKDYIWGNASSVVDVINSALLDGDDFDAVAELWENEADRNGGILLDPTRLAEAFEKALAEALEEECRHCETIATLHTCKCGRKQVIFDCEHHTNACGGCE
jgi:hypothetical protein